MTSTEQVLVVDNNYLDIKQNFIPANKFNFSDLEDHYFVERVIAEHDENIRQIIPYCIFSQGDSILMYRRTSKSGETRLHGKWSAGIGGHINPCDAIEWYPIPSVILNNVAREVREELTWEGIDDFDFSNPKILGVILDNATPVGRVHLGLVLEYTLPVVDVRSNEGSVDNLTWFSNPNALPANQVEDWTTIALENRANTEPLSFKAVFGSQPKPKPELDDYYVDFESPEYGELSVQQKVDEFQKHLALILADEATCMELLRRNNPS